MKKNIIYRRILETVREETGREEMTQTGRGRKGPPRGLSSKEGYLASKYAQQPHLKPNTETPLSSEVQARVDAHNKRAKAFEKVHGRPYNHLLDGDRDWEDESEKKPESDSKKKSTKKPTKKSTKKPRVKRGGGRSTNA